MTSVDVLDIYNQFKENCIDVWIVGGWCVNALLGKQTREHGDLDIAVHAFEYDKNGKIIYGIEFPFGSLTGTGVIDG